MAQLRTRLQDRAVHWRETRSAADLDAALVGVACPVVLLDLERNIEGLRDLLRMARLSPGARALVLDPEATEEVPAVARELGATEVISGFIPPPEVAARIGHWISLAALQIEREGWSRPLAVEAPDDPESWLECILNRSLNSSDQSDPG